MLASKWLKYFITFYKKNSDQYYSCQKLIRPASITENNRRLWFFAYLSAFFNLEKNGYYYTCKDKAWVYNLKIDNNKFSNDQNIELERCKSRYFELSFDKAINSLSLMSNQTNKSFRFIEYDNGQGGSHQKLYSWIPTSNRTINCKEKSQNRPVFDLFPQDVNWQSFNPNDDSTIK